MVQGSLYYQPKQCTAIYAEILQNNYMYICCMFDPHKMCHLMTPVANQRTYGIIASKTSFGRNIKTLIIPAPTKNSETKSSKTKRFHSQNHRKNIPNVEKKTMPEASFGVVRCRLPGFPQPIWKIIKLDHETPRFGVKKRKFLKPPSWRCHFHQWKFRLSWTNARHPACHTQKGKNKGEIPWDMKKCGSK